MSDHGTQQPLGEEYMPEKVTVMGSVEETLARGGERKQCGTRMTMMSHEFQVDEKVLRVEITFFTHGSVYLYIKILNLF